MLVLIRRCITCAGILNLQEVWFSEVHAPSIQIMPVLLFEGLADHKVDMVAADGTIVGQRVLYQRVRNSAAVLGKTLVALVEIYTVALDPSRNPCFILGMSLAIGKIDLIVEFVILALDAKHCQEVNVSRTRTNNAINNRITGQQVIDEQGVRSRDIAMHSVVINAVAVGIIIETAGRTNLIIEDPSRVVICLDGGLHQQRTTKHIGHITIEALYVL